jgi:glutathione S-transferase
VNLPILYSFRRCPYAMRARLALLASGVKYEHREVVLRDKPAQLLAASPKGTVPVLVLPNGQEMGQVIDQSVDIMLWALRQNDPFGWLENEADALKLIAHCDGDFKYHLDRYKYPNRYTTPQALCEPLAHRSKAAEFAATVDRQLENKRYIFDSCSGIYYAGLLPFLRQFSNTDKVWFAQQPWPHLQALLRFFEASAEFKTTMQTYPQWHQGSH